MIRKPTHTADSTKIKIKKKKKEEGRAEDTLLSEVTQAQKNSAAGPQAVS